MERNRKRMNFLQNIRNSLIRFMYGRNGMDQLNRALFWVYIGICFVRAIFSAVLESTVFAAIFGILLNVTAVVLLFRMFSKNLPKRRAENQAWINWWYSFKSRQTGARARHADKDHKYFTCKSCKTICRVPVGKGKIVITCPKCGSKIQRKT